MKMRQILTAMLFMAFTVPAAFAQDAGDFNLNATKDISVDLNIPLPQPQPLSPAAADTAGPIQRKEWTVMAFMNGSNSLSEDILYDVKTMSSVGSMDNINMVAEFSILTGQSSLVRRMRLLPDSGGEINGEVYKTWQNLDMGGPCANGEPPSIGGSHFYAGSRVRTVSSR